MKKATDPGKVVIVHHPPQPDTKPNSQTQGTPQSTGPEAEDKTESASENDKGKSSTLTK